MAINGKIFHVNPSQCQFVLLKETEYDPITNEGVSRLNITWTSETQFTRVDRAADLHDVNGPVIAQIKAFRDADIRELPENEPIVTLDIKVFADASEAEGLSSDGTSVIGWFTPDPDNVRTGAVEFGGITLPVQLRGPRAVVETHTRTGANEINKGFWSAKVEIEDGSQPLNAHSIVVSPEIDPRTVDDPTLPRVLVIGDSISMNYHETAKAELAGVANYYRVEGNAGPSDRGVSCVELWIGEYSEPGLHWDLIQFNHGLHDLKQAFEPNTGDYGEYQLCPESYKANLEKEIAVLKKTGAKLMWCTTTPVPKSSVWASQDIGRKHGADLVYNDVAMEVMAGHPEIMINDLNTAVRNADFYAEWSQGTDVHFWNNAQQLEVGKAVAEAIKHALAHRP